MARIRAGVEGDVPRLSWLDCTFDSGRGLADADRVRLAGQVRSTQSDRQADGVIVTVALREVDNAGVDDGAIYRLLEFVSSIARSRTVVVVFPDADPHTLDLSVAMLDEESAAASGEGSYGPILVLGRDGEPVWCGGPVPERAVLTMLSGPADTADIHEARRCWQQAGGEAARFSEMLRANTHLLSNSAETVQLRLSVSLVQATVERAISQSLAEAIDHGGDGVDRGVFRGPTLGLTNRWIHVEEFLARTVGFNLAAFVLARKVETALRASAQAEEPTAIFQVSSAPEPLGRHLSECLGLAGRYHSQPSELSFGEPSIGEQVPVGAKVVLCADTIRSEDTIRRAVAIAASRDADPLIIACAVDARDSHGPIRLLNRTIPVVSLTEVNIAYGTPTDEQIIDIDLLTLRPVVPAPVRPERVHGEDLFASFDPSAEALRLGHVDGPPHRHYSAFVSPYTLLQGETQKRITAAVLFNVKLALADLHARASYKSPLESPIAIWYVASDGNTEVLVDIVRKLLNEENVKVDTVTPIRRLTAGQAWEFPDIISNVGEPVTVVIIHSWAITGNTLEQLVRLAAESGASSIAAVCMLNQMDAKNAAFLQMLRSVSGFTMATDGISSADNSAHAESIPVAIRFVASSGIIAFETHGCPICATQERYQTTQERYQLPEDVAPPRLKPRLIQHAELLRDILRRREWREASRDSAADLFTVSVTGHEALDYLRWRKLLLRALRTVSARQEVIDRLHALTGQTPTATEWTSTGLIRLLAAEQQWLRLPPLYFASATDRLSQVCVSCLQQVTTATWLRVQALMVMSVANPEQLVRLLPRLLDLAGNNAVLIDQILLDCCGLLLRATGDMPFDIALLRSNLRDCRDFLEERGSEPEALAGDHLHDIRSLLTIADYHILDKPRDSQEAWARLREDLGRPVVRHRLEAGLHLVRGFVEDIEQVQPSAESARMADAAWDACARQLQQRALANLPPLRDILEGDFAADWLGRSDQNRLLTLARPGVGELRAVTDKLHSLAFGPWRHADPPWQAERRALLERINWWNHMFLAAHVTNGEAPALLVELIRTAPIELGECVLKHLDSHHVQATIKAPAHGEVQVFCPDRLLRQVIAHLLDNVEKHRARESAYDCQLQIEYLPPARNAARMVVRNSGTSPSTPPGRGLKALDEMLQPFGGKLVWQFLADGEWTFGVTATLPLWRGG